MLAFCFLFEIVCLFVFSLNLSCLVVVFCFSVPSSLSLSLSFLSVVMSSGSHSDDEGGDFGNLFGEAEAAVEVIPQYPIETLLVDRVHIASEGVTNKGFTPLLDRFDHMGISEVACETSSTSGAAATATTTTLLSEDAQQQRLLTLRQRLVQLQPPPLTVFFRNKRHSLWGHKLWNAAKYLTKRMDEGLIDVYGKSVLELGAGLGVPTLAAFKNGARVAVVTDYPDADLLEIIEMNVKENCQPGQVDADVRARYEADALARLQQHARESAGGADTAKVVPEALTEAQAAAAVHTVCTVEPLLWGKAEHIEKALSYTAGAGFDVVILSDILFNHVCNDDLADTVAQTLQRSPSAAAYCVFSHHRAHKQLHDLEFFDKCVARGMCYEQIDEQEYEMMFPEDRGPVEVRQPVKCYRITHRFDDAGPPLSVTAAYDVVLQGTGLVQCYLSAALARSGLRVLHCDGEDYYGATWATFSMEQLVEHLERWKATASSGTSPSSKRALPSPVVVVDRSDTLSPRDRRRFQIDLLPATYMSNGEAIQHLVRFGMTHTIEFQNVAQFGFLFPSTATASATATAAETASHGHDGAGSVSSPSTLRFASVPLTRAEVFATTAVGLLDKRRLMKFVKDVETTLVEQFHAKSASPADDPALTAKAAAVAAEQAASAFLQEAEAHPGTTLSALLKRKYSLSGSALDMITLMQQLDVHEAAPLQRANATNPATEKRNEDEHAASLITSSEPGLLRSVRLVRQLLTSVGAYGGATPFLVPAYGASEMPQGMCRTSAVWGGVFVLRRSVSRVLLDETKDRQYAVLSNGQWVSAKVIVAPSEVADQLPLRVNDWQQILQLEAARAKGQIDLAQLRAGPASGYSSSGSGVDGDTTYGAGLESDVQYARVVIASRRALFTSTAETSNVTHPTKPKTSEEGVSDATAGGDVTDVPPVVIALTRAAVSDGEEGPSGEAVVHVVQQTLASEQAPEGAAVLHFTVNAADMTQAQLLRFVTSHFCSNVGEGAVAEESEGARAPSSPRELRVDYEKDVVFMAAFTMSARQAARDGLVASAVDVPSETRFTHAYALGEAAKLREATEHDRRHLRHEDEPNAAAPHTEGEANASVAANAITAPVLSETLRKTLSMVWVPTLLENVLNDGQYMELARSAYGVVLQRLGLGVSSVEEAQSAAATAKGSAPAAAEAAAPHAKRYVFMEKLPPPPTSTSASAL